MRLSIAMRNMLTHLADGRPASTNRLTLESLLARRAIALTNGILIITPAGLAAIGRTV